MGRRSRHTDDIEHSPDQSSTGVPLSHPSAAGQQEPRAVLVAVAPPGVESAASGMRPIDASLAELAQLATTAGIVPATSLTQRLRSPNPNTYVNKGKLGEIVEMLREQRCTLVITDDELTPVQQRGLEEVCGPGTVMDRTGLILDIFASRARSREGQLQVELARAQYALPRLVRLWSHLERQRGGTGTRGGAGETQIESDRRLIRQRIARLEREIDTVRRHRETERQRRSELMPTAALVGYTNAGKSTLLNRLTSGGAEAANKLFATLDPTVRQWHVAQHHSLLLADTVGFIHKLPATVVAAFRATLEEAASAAFLFHVIDASSPFAIFEASVVLKELDDIGATGIIVPIFNKIDLLPAAERETRLAALWDRFPLGIAISSLSGEGLALLASRVAQQL